MSDDDLYFVVVTRTVDAAERVGLYGPFTQERAMRAVSDAIAAGPCRTDILTRAELDAQAADGSSRGDKLYDAIRAAKLPEPVGPISTARAARIFENWLHGVAELRAWFSANGVTTLDQLLAMDMPQLRLRGRPDLERHTLVDSGVAQVAESTALRNYVLSQAYPKCSLGAILCEINRAAAGRPASSNLPLLPPLHHGWLAGCGITTLEELATLTPAALAARTGGGARLVASVVGLSGAKDIAQRIRNIAQTGGADGSFLSIWRAFSPEPEAALAGSPELSAEELSAIFRQVEHAMPVAVRALLQSARIETLQALLTWHVGMLARNGINGTERGLAIAALLQVADLHRIAFRAIIRSHAPAVGTLGAICAAWLSAIEPSKLHKQLQLPQLLVAQLAACGITTVAQLVMCDVYTLQKRYGLSMGQVADVMRAISDAAPATRQLMEKLEPGRSGALLTMYRS